MTSEPDQSQPRDSAHLDEDAECLEDPVHCGDARHQHEAHTLPDDGETSATT